MKLITLLSLFSLVTAYNTDTVSTFCFFVTTDCYKTHAKEIEMAINRRPGEYISHSTISNKSGLQTSIIVYK